MHIVSPLLLILVIVAEFTSAAEVAARRKLPKVNGKGMMRWKKWWWNNREGMRQCDDPYGCNDMDDATEKASFIKKRWEVDSDSELLTYMREVRAHARSYSWREGGRVYSFCLKYQGDLQDVLDYLELKEAKAKRKRARRSATVTQSSTGAATHAAAQDLATTAPLSEGVVVPEEAQEGGAARHADDAIDKKVHGNDYHQTRDRVESVDVWQQSKEAATEGSSWAIAALGALWSYIAGWVRLSGKRVDNEL